jgi:tetratricopeptide (TPR) repeat protein
MKEPAPATSVPTSSKLWSYLRNKWTHCVLLGIVGFAVRMPALQGQLVWDDTFLARDNPFMKSPVFILEVFRHYLFLDSFSGHYRPVQNLSFIFDYFFWNGDVYGFHLTNVLLHVASGLLLYFLLRKLLLPLTAARSDAADGSAPLSFDVSWVALIVAALWIVHPVHSAAVDYISGRADSLAFMLACGAWLVFLRGRASSHRLLRGALFVVAALLALLALGSREIAAIWIALFLLHLLVFERTLSRRSSIAVVIACLALVGLYAGLRQLPGPRVTTNPVAGWTAPMRAVLMLRALGDYGRLMIFPSNLHMERTVLEPQNYFSNQSWRSSVATEYLSIAGLAVLAMFSLGMKRRGPGRNVRIFGVCWFALGFLPISNLVELNATAAEHWLYLPSVGFLIFLAGCAIDLPLRWRTPAMAFACLVVAGMGARSWVRSSDWVSDLTFYQRTLAAGGTSTRVAANLAQIYSTRGEYAKAEAMFRRVLKMSPDYPIARNNLAEALARQGKAKESEELLASTTKATESTRKEYPRTWIAVLNLAYMRQKQNDDEGALAIAEKAGRDYPGVWEVIRLESDLLQKTGQQDAALRIVDEFAQANWWHYESWIALGRLYQDKKDLARAETVLRHASWLDVHGVEALNLIAVMRMQQHRFDEACSTQRRAVARQPDAPRQYILLSNILEKSGHAEEARETYAQIARMQSAAQAQPVVN